MDPRPSPPHEIDYPVSFLQPLQPIDGPPRQPGEEIYDGDSVRAPSHYTSGGIQPIDFVTANKMPFSEGNVVKYITRHSMKNGAEDVRKAIQYALFILAKTYGERYKLVAA